MNPFVGTSSQPVLLDNLLARENLIGNQIAMPVENSKKRHPTINVLSSDNGDPPAKRRLNFVDMDKGHDPAIAPVPSVTITNQDLSQSFNGMEHMEDEDYAAVTDFGIVKRGGNL